MVMLRTIDTLWAALDRLQSGSRRFRQCCGAIVEDERSQSIVLGAIVTNAIMMGFGTFDFSDSMILLLLNTFDQAFLILFTVELVLHFIHKGPFIMFRNSWLCFDTLVVLASWLLEQFQIARAFRILRAVRLVTHLESLRMILAALAKVLPRLYSVVGLFFIILYIYAVLCTELFADLYMRGLTDDDYFGSLDKSMFTLFQFMTAENWNAIARQVIRHYYWARPVFCSFVVITNFVLYSLLAAVFCHAVRRRDGDEDEAMQLLEQARQRVEEAHERQILVLCQCQVLMPHTDLAVFSPKRRSEVLSRQVSFRIGSHPSRRSLNKALSKTDDNLSTLSILSENMIEYGETKFTKVLSFREKCKELVNDYRYQAVSATLVALNAIVLGVETLDFVENNVRVSDVFDKINSWFLIVFTFELGFNLFASGGLVSVIRDPWLCFDFVIVAVCWSVERLAVARSLRIIRVFQLGRRFKPLQDLIGVLVGSAPSISGVLLLFLLIVYMFAVLCTELFGDLYYYDRITDYDYFGRLDKSTLTLFQMLTLEGWGEISRQVETVYPWAWSVFCTYLILTSAILFSMIIGYMTDAAKGAGMVTNRELEQRARHLHRKLQSLNGQQKTLLRIVNHCIQFKESTSPKPRGRCP